MTFALAFLSQITNEIFERQFERHMRRAAVRISARQYLFPDQAA